MDPNTSGASGFAGGLGALGIPVSGAPMMHRTIHVGNLNGQVTAEILRQIFECIGKIKDVRVSADGRYGFVDFEEAQAATASLQMSGTVVCGSAIRVQRATQPKIIGNQAVPPPLPMLAQCQPGGVGELTALAGVTSPAALAALAKQAQSGGTSTAPTSDFAFLNPAQQRAALEARHREMLAKSNNLKSWGVAKRREESSSSSSSRKRSASPSSRSDSSDHSHRKKSSSSSRRRSTNPSYSYSRRGEKRTRRYTAPDEHYSDHRYSAPRRRDSFRRFSSSDHRRRSRYSSDDQSSNSEDNSRRRRSVSRDRDYYDRDRPSRSRHYHSSRKRSHQNYPSHRSSTFKNANNGAHVQRNNEEPPPVVELEEKSLPISLPTSIQPPTRPEEEQKSAPNQTQA